MSYKRGNTWYITVSGVRRSAGTTDRKKAIALEHKLNAEAWERRHYGIRFSTWDEACLDWFKKKGASLRPITLKKQSYIAQYWQKQLSGKALRSITTELVTNLLLERPGVNPNQETPENATANNYACFVSKVMRHAGISLAFYSFPVSSGREQWLSVEQWLDIESVMSDEVRHIATFSLATGLRKSNVTGLKWEWIKGESLLIPSAMTKTKVAYGIPLNKTAMGILQERRASPVVHTQNVFTLGGKEVLELALHRAWKRALDEAGVEDMTYHGLRHTYASWMVQAGVPFEIVARLGQWKLGGMVHRYAHFDSESLRSWCLKFDTILAQGAVSRSQVSENIAVS
jgi:integrase